MCDSYKSLPSSDVYMRTATPSPRGVIGLALLGSLLSFGLLWALPWGVSSWQSVSVVAGVAGAIGYAIHRWERYSVGVLPGEETS